MWFESNAFPAPSGDSILACVPVNAMYACDCDTTAVLCDQREGAAGGKVADFGIRVSGGRVKEGIQPAPSMHLPKSESLHMCLSFIVIPLQCCVTKGRELQKAKELIVDYERQVEE